MNFHASSPKFTSVEQVCKIGEKRSGRVEKRGIYGKYRVEKSDGSPVDPKAVYFTLRLDTDPHARAAVRAYAASCQAENPDLAADLINLLEDLENAQK